MLGAFLMVAVLGAATAATAATSWVSDASRSQLGFTSAYIGEPVRGVFRKWNAQLDFDPNDLAHSKLVVTVDTGSVQTGVEEQDGALIGTDWLSSNVFPQASFATKEIRRGHADGAFEATGDLTLRGITKPVSIAFTASANASELVIRGGATLDRSDFKVGIGPWSTGDSVPLGVQIQFDMVALRADSAGAPAPGTAASVQPSASRTPSAARAAPLQSVPETRGSSAPSGDSTPGDDYTPTPAFANQTRAPAPRTPSSFQAQVLADGLVQPWSLAFLPDGRMLVTERPGRLRIISPDGTKSPPIEGLPPIKTIAAEGLHDVLPDRDFARNRTIYFSYYAPRPNDEPATVQAWIEWLKLPAGEHEKQPFGFERVAKARLSRDERRLEDVQVILEGGNRRLAFARDGSLMVAAAPPAGGGIPVDDEPQRLSNTYGKVLRIERDGSVPRNNPFVGKAGVRPEIYAYGLRDIEGAAIHPRTGTLWTVEHGPRGGDELNIVRAGRNYGFPLISYGREYSGELIHEGRTAQQGLEQPVYYWTPSIAPSGLLFYTGNLFPEWQRSVFVGALAGKRLIRLELERDRVIAEEALLVERGKRIRDVRQGPDGALYVLTAEAAGELLKLIPP